MMTLQSLSWTLIAAGLIACSTLLSCADRLPSDSGRIRFDQNDDEYWELVAVRRNHVKERHGVRYSLNWAGIPLDSSTLLPIIYDAMPQGGIRKTTFLRDPKDKSKSRPFNT